jgi:hypothetical protein
MDSVRGAARRLARAWRALSGEQRLAAFAAFGLIFTMFLPWYEKSTIPPGRRDFVHDTISAFGAVSFVEAAVFLVAVGVLVLLFARAEGRAFHLPGGDGTVILAAGVWAALLIFWRVFDRPNVGGGRGSTVGIQWGFFVAFVAAGFLAYAGARLRAAHRPEPPLPEPPPPPPRPPDDAPTVRRRRPREDDERPAPEQLSFDEAETRRLRE